MTWLMLLLKNWKESLIALMALAVAGLYWIAKFYRRKNKRLEHEIKVKDKVTEISKEQEVFKATVLSKEQDKILEVIDDNAKKSMLDRANNL